MKSTLEASIIMPVARSHRADSNGCGITSGDALEPELWAFQVWPYVRITWPILAVGLGHQVLASPRLHFKSYGTLAILTFFLFFFVSNENPGLAIFRRDLVATPLLYDHRACLAIIGHVLWSKDMSYDRRTCPTILGLCPMIIGHLLWS